MRATTDIILRGLCWILFLAGVTTLITACTETQAPEQLVFADPNQPMAALVYIAEAQGYFKDENLSLSYKKFTSGRDALRSVLAGEADVGVATEFPFASNLQQGAPLRILATLMRTNHYDALVGRRDLGIASLADLAGKRIGVAPHTNSEFMLSRMLREVAIPEDRVTRVPLKPEQMVEALARGEVDGIATWMPHIADRYPENAELHQSGALGYASHHPGRKARGPAASAPGPGTGAGLSVRPPRRGLASVGGAPRLRTEGAHAAGLERPEIPGASGQYAADDPRERGRLAGCPVQSPGTGTGLPGGPGDGDPGGSASRGRDPGTMSGPGHA